MFKGMPININLSANLFLNLLVYATLGSSAMFSFEFVLLSKELANKFSLIDIFFQSCKLLAIVCMLLRMKRQAFCFLTFICSWLQRRNN